MSAEQGPDDWKDNFDTLRSQFKQLQKNGRILTKSETISTEVREAGNKLYTRQGHDSQIHRDVLSLYSKSIAFAPKGSEELVLGYSNRSSLLMHVHRYKESLIDIDRALQLPQSDELKKKLQARREKCLKLISEKDLEDSGNCSNSSDTEDQERFSSELINFKPSATLPCASDSVGLAYNDDFGRHLVATRDIEPGEILIVEQGFCYPERWLIYIVCSHCLQIAWNGIPCDDCVFAIYCSEACKNQAFEEYHDIECPIIKYMNGMSKKMFDEMFVVRLLVTFVKREGLKCIIDEAQKKTERKGDLQSLLSDGMFCANKFKPFYNLLSYENDVEIDNDNDDVRESIMVYLLAEHTDFFNIGQNTTCNVTIESQVLSSIKEILTEMKSIWKLNGYWYQAFLDCQCRTFKDCKKTCNSIRGRIFTSACSLLNHSCMPNVTPVCVPKRKFMVFANNPIKKGEQLYSNYGATCTQEVHERQSNLKRFNFNCKCMACRDSFIVTKSDALIDTYLTKYKDDIRTEYYQCYSKDIKESVIFTSINDWEISEDLLKEVKKTSELFYKHMDCYTAFAFNSRCTHFINLLLLKLYGEKGVIPSDC